jgi:hypothetical protein
MSATQQLHESDGAKSFVEAWKDLMSRIERQCVALAA